MKQMKLIAAILYSLLLTACFVDDEMIADVYGPEFDAVYGRYDREMINAPELEKEVMLIKRTDEIFRAGNGKTYPIIEVQVREYAVSGEIRNREIRVVPSRLTTDGLGVAAVLPMKTDGKEVDFNLANNPFLVFSVDQGALTIWRMPLLAPEAIVQELGRTTGNIYEMSRVRTILKRSPQDVLKDISPGIYIKQGLPGIASPPAVDITYEACKSDVTNHLASCSSAMGSCDLGGGCSTKVSCRPQLNSYKCRHYIQLFEKWGGFKCDIRTGYFHENTQNVIDKACR